MAGYPNSYDATEPEDATVPRRYGGRAQIVEELMAVADKPFSCRDYPLKTWLNRFASHGQPTDFTSAALLIVNAGLIYGRKVDYLSGLVHGAADVAEADGDNNAAAASAEGADGTAEGAAAAAAPKRRNQRAQRQPTADDDERDYGLVPVRPRSEEALTETRHSSSSSSSSSSRSATSTSTTTSSPAEPFHSLCSATAANRPISYRRVQLLQRSQVATAACVFGRARIAAGADEEADFTGKYAAFQHCLYVADCGLGQRTLSLRHRRSRHRRAGSRDSLGPAEAAADICGRPYPLFRSAAEMLQQYDLQVANNEDYVNLRRMRQQVQREQLLRMDRDALLGCRQGRQLAAMLNGRVCSEADEDEAEEEAEAESTHQRFSIGSFGDCTLPNMESTRILSEGEVEALNTSGQGGEGGSASQDSGLGSSAQGDSQATQDNADISDDVARCGAPEDAAQIPDISPAMDSIRERSRSRSRPPTDYADAELQQIAAALEIKSRQSSVDEGIGLDCADARLAQFTPTLELTDLFGALQSPGQLPVGFSVALDSETMAKMRGEAQQFPAVLEAGIPLPGGELPMAPPPAKTAPAEALKLAVNCLRIPEARMLRVRLFRLPAEEFEVWVAVGGKRRQPAEGEAVAVAAAKRLMRRAMSPAASSMGDGGEWDRETEGFAGFGEEDLRRGGEVAEGAESVAVKAEAAPAIAKAEEEETPVSDSLAEAGKLEPSLSGDSGFSEASAVNSETLETSQQPPPLTVEASTVEQSVSGDSGFSEADSAQLQSSCSDAETSAAAAAEAPQPPAEAPRPSEEMPEFNVTAAADDQDAADDAAADDMEQSTDADHHQLANFDEMKALTERVTEWHQSLRATLAQSQQHNHFDIHEYGTHILDTVRGGKVKRKSQTMAEKSAAIDATFADVLQQNGCGSVANYFLSLLQLVNFGNVALIGASEAGGQAEPRVREHRELGIRLLSEQRHAVEIEK